MSLKPLPISSEFSEFLYVLHLGGGGKVHNPLQILYKKFSHITPVVALSCLLISYTGEKLHFLAPIGTLDNFKNQCATMWIAHDIGRPDRRTFRQTMEQHAFGKYQWAVLYPFFSGKFFRRDPLGLLHRMAGWKGNYCWQALQGSKKDGQVRLWM